MNGAPFPAAQAIAGATNADMLEILLGSKERIQKQIAAGQHSPPEILALETNLATLETQIQAELNRIGAALALENRGMT